MILPHQWLWMNRALGMLRGLWLDGICQVWDMDLPRGRYPRSLKPLFTMASATARKVDSSAAQRETGWAREARHLGPAGFSFPKLPKKDLGPVGVLEKG